MRAPGFVLCAAVLLQPVGVLSAGKSRDWKEGIVVGVSDVGFTTQSGTSTTQGRVQGGNINATTQRYSWKHQRWTYAIDAGEYLYVASHVLSFRWSKPCKVTVNGPVKYALEDGKLYVLDEVNREHKLQIDRTVLKPTPPPPNTTQTLAAPALPSNAAAGGEVKKGMSPQEVEQLLGKPLRHVTFENKVRWTYRDVVVLFENERVTEVTFP